MGNFKLKRILLVLSITAIIQSYSLQSTHAAVVKIVPNEQVCDSLKNKALKEFLISKYTQAIADFDSALRYRSGSKNLLAVIYTYRAATEIGLGNYKNALDDCDTAIKLNGKSGIARWFKLEAEFYLGDYEAAGNGNDEDKAMALISYKEVASIMAGLKYNEGEIYSMYEDLQRKAYWYCELAKKEFKIKTFGITHGQDSLADLYYTAGLYYSAINNYDSAEESYIKAYDVDSFYRAAENLASRGDNDMGNCNFELANKEYTQAIDVYKFEHEYVIAGFTFESRAESEEALKQYENAIKDETLAIANEKGGYAENNCNSYFEIGKCYWLLNKKDEAKLNFEKVIEIGDGPDSAMINDRTLIAFSLFFLGDTANAYSTMEDQMNEDEGNSTSLGSTYYNMSCLLALMNNPKESIHYLELATMYGLDKQDVLDDPFFDNIKNTPEFIELMKQ